MDNWRKDFYLLKMWVYFCLYSKKNNKKKMFKKWTKKEKEIQLLKEEDMLNLIYYMIVEPNLD